MRKALSVILTAAIIILALASCKKANEESVPPAIESPPTSTSSETGSPPTSTYSETGNSPTSMPSETETPPDSLDISRFKEELAGLWSHIDGSTATIPLTAALHSAFGDGGSPPKHNTTSYAYDNLFWGVDTELIFVTYPSEYELEVFKNNDVPLMIVPIAKDALVFLVNVENKINSISLKQIQDIYSGKTVNWNALGGYDEKIIAYQRTANSGSQTLLKKLVMNNTQLAASPSDWEISEMGRLVEVVSGYDNSRGAIGYSMFYYVNNMYGNSRFKLLSIDGVKPSRETIISSEYPLGDNYYAVIRQDMPMNHPARKLLSWLLTDEGQALIAKAGYIPLRPIDSAWPDSTIDPIYLGDTDDSSGTGGKMLKTSVDDVQPVNGVRPPLSDLFFDGYNYVRYINGKIMEEINKGDPDEWRIGTWGDVHQTRPFIGIPNNYPNYEISYRGYLWIVFPQSNPFFNYAASFYISLSSDISPYGTEQLDECKITYEYAASTKPGVKLLAAGVELRDKPDASKRLNEQLKAWTESLLNNKEIMQRLNSYVIWSSDVALDDWKEKYAAVTLIPYIGKWRDYLTVTYMLSVFEDESSSMLSTICFDINTGDAVSLPEKLPADLDYSEADIYKVDKIMEANEGWFRETYGRLEAYTPAAGSVITDAFMYVGWISSGWKSYDALMCTPCIRMIEPSGRILEIYLFLE